MGSYTVFVATTRWVYQSVVLAGRTISVKFSMNDELVRHDTVLVRTRKTRIRPKKNICVFQVSALKKLGMVGRHNILFCQNILRTKCIFQYIFPHFSANLTVFCSQFTIICLGSGQKPR